MPCPRWSVHGLLLAGLALSFSSRPVPRREILRSRGMEATFDATGCRVDPARWGVRLAGWGRSGAWEVPASRAPFRQDAQVRFEHGGLLEWYAPHPWGVEQGFDVRRRPDGCGPLRVELAVRGGLSVLERGTERIVFGRHGRSLLCYQDLQAFDAEGRRLPARMRIQGPSLTLEVDDDGAAYPVRIDPLLTPTAWTVESNQSGAWLGTSLAAGDVNRDGYSDLVVSVWRYDNAEVDEGRLEAYFGASGGLSTSVAWRVEHNQANARLGPSIACGDFNADGYSDVLSSAMVFDNGQTDEGRAYAWLGGAAGLSTTASWTVEVDQASGSFGSSVAAADVDRDGFSDAAVGASQFDNGEVDEGRVYLFRGGSAGLSTTVSWAVEANQASASAGGDTGGQSTNAIGMGDFNGDGFSDVAVGAHFFDNGQSDEGRVFVFHGSASGLSTTAVWMLEGDQASADFGLFVAGAGDVDSDGYSDLLVGSERFDNGEIDEGRAFLFRGSASGPGTSPSWTVEGNQASGFFGRSVARAGDLDGDGFSDVAVGARWLDNGETDEGRVYVYHGSGSGPRTASDWIVESNVASAFLGYTVAPSGDVDADGFADLAVGARNFQNGHAGEGRAFLFHGDGIRKGPPATSPRSSGNVIDSLLAQGCFLSAARRRRSDP